MLTVLRVVVVRHDGGQDVVGGGEVAGAGEGGVHVDGLAVEGRSVPLLVNID